jgi:hypothetical protein
MSTRSKNLPTSGSLNFEQNYRNGLKLSVSISTNKPVTIATLKAVVIAIGQRLSELGTTPIPLSGRKPSRISARSYRLVMERDGWGEPTGWLVFKRPSKRARKKT